MRCRIWDNERFQFDIDRSNALELERWDGYTLTWMQVTRDPDEVVAFVKRAFEAAAIRMRSANG